MYKYTIQERSSYSGDMCEKISEGIQVVQHPCNDAK